MANSPIPTLRLRQICNDACDSAIASTTVYDHAQTQTWNNTIINNILKALLSESSSPSPAAAAGQAGGQASGSGTGSAADKYKFIVNATIIQHLSDPRSAGTEAPEKKVGRRGMHSASGAFWNNEKDGMWSYKYEGGEGKGMDIVVNVLWVAV